MTSATFAPPERSYRSYRSELPAPSAVILGTAGGAGLCFRPRSSGQRTGAHLDSARESLKARCDPIEVAVLGGDGNNEVIDIIIRSGCDIHTVDVEKYCG